MTGSKCKAWQYPGQWPGHHCGQWQHQQQCLRHRTKEVLSSAKALRACVCNCWALFCSYSLAAVVQSYAQSAQAPLCHRIQIYKCRMSHSNDFAAVIDTLNDMFQIEKFVTALNRYMYIVLILWYSEWENISVDGYVQHIVYSNKAFFSIFMISISTSYHLCNVSYTYVSAPNAYQQSLAAESTELNDLLNSETAIEDKPSEATNIQAESRINNNDNFKV